MNNIQINLFNRSEAVSALTAMKASFTNHSPNKFQKLDQNKPQIQSIRAVWRLLANRLLDILINHGGVFPEEQGEDIDKSIEELTFLLVSDNKHDDDDKDTIRTQCAEIMRIAGPILLAAPSTYNKLDHLIKTQKHALETPSLPVTKKIKKTDSRDTSCDSILDSTQQKLDQTDQTQGLEKRWALIQEADRLFRSVEDPDHDQLKRINVMKLEIGLNMFLCATNLAENLYEQAITIKNIDRRRALLLEANEYLGRVKRAANFYGLEQIELQKLNQSEEKVGKALPNQQEMHVLWIRQLITLTYDVQGILNTIKRTSMSSAPLPTILARRNPCVFAKMNPEYDKLTTLRKQLFALETTSLQELMDEKIKKMETEVLLLAEAIIKKIKSSKSNNSLGYVEKFLLGKAIRKIEGLKAAEINGNISLGSSLHKQPHAIKKTVTFQPGIVEPAPWRTNGRTDAKISIPDTIFDYEHRPQNVLDLEKLSTYWGRLKAIMSQHAPVVNCYNKDDVFSEGSDDVLIDPPEGSAQDLSARLEQVQSDVRINLFKIYQGKRADKNTRTESDKGSEVSIQEIIENLYAVGLEMKQLPGISYEEQATIAACLDGINASYIDQT